MARKPRKTTRGLTHHVYSRCIESRYLLHDRIASDLLLEILRKTQDKYRFELGSFQIMEDHFHLVITTVKEGASISRIMQYFKARYAERYNAMTGRIGPFWNERFKDVIVEEAEAPKEFLLGLLWYNAFNPVRRGIVDDPRAYRYSSINSYLNEKHKSPVKITLHRFFLGLGNTFRQSAQAFQHYEEAYCNKSG